MYKYKLRPEYGCSKLLIEFIDGVENETFLSDFIHTISELNPVVEDIIDLWMNE